MSPKLLTTIRSARLRCKRTGKTRLRSESTAPCTTSAFWRSLRQRWTTYDAIFQTKGRPMCRLPFRSGRIHRRSGTRLVIFRARWSGGLLRQVGPSKGISTVTIISLLSNRDLALGIAVMPGANAMTRRIKGHVALFAVHARSAFGSGMPAVATKLKGVSMPRIISSQSRRVLGGAVAVAIGLGAVWTVFAQQENVGISGTANKATLEKVYPAKPHYSPYAGAPFRRGHCSATRTCTPASRWTRARLARVSLRATRIGSPAAMR